MIMPVLYGMSKKLAVQLDEAVAKHHMPGSFYEGRAHFLRDELLSCLKIDLYIQHGGETPYTMKEVRALLDSELAKRGGVD
jgi:hypothetical protein